MIACGRGDVVLVGFVFSDESGRKVRPALVISSPAYQVRRRLFADHLPADTMIDRKLGSLPGADLRAVERQLRRALGF